MMSRIVTTRSFLLIAFILLVEAVFCSQIPLLNYLGFEFSLLNALVAGFLCGLLAIAEWKKHSLSSEGDYWNYVWSVLAASSLLILIPLLVISANAFFIKNCSFTQGFRLYVLYVIPSVTLCVSLATLSSVFARKRKKTLFLFLFLLVLAQIPFVTLTRPQIFAFNPIVGYFPGFTYDESLGGEARLLVYRVSTFAAAASLFVISLTLLKYISTDFKRSSDKKRITTYVAILLVGIVVCGGLYQMSDSVGLSSSDSFITKELGGVRYAPHFRIVYPRNAVTPDRLRQIVLLHEYLFDELREEWHINPRRPITVFIYASPRQKYRLIGAAATDFTKPWLRQVNINLDDVNAVLKHELVHAMLAENGIPFLQVAPNSGLIEGAAVATQRFEYGESLHRLAAQILALGIQPNVAEMFTLSGFFKSYPGVSYVLAGSFCRFLVDRYGTKTFKELYGSGNFHRWYGKDLDTLVAQWRSAIGREVLTSQQLEKAAYLFKRSPVFGKVCARVIADINKHTRALIDRKQFPEALASAEYSMSLTKNVDAVYQKSYVLMHLVRYNEATSFMRQQFADTALSPSLLPLRLTLGDSYWAVGDTESAREQYRSLLADSLSLSVNEALALRLQMLPHRRVQEAFKPYFLEDMGDSVRVAFLEKLKETPATDIFARCLLGREYALKGDDSKVVQELRILPPMHSPILEYVRDFRIAHALYHLGDYERAKVYAWRGLNFAANSAQFYQFEDLLRRCFWIEGQGR